MFLVQECDGRVLNLWRAFKRFANRFPTMKGLEPGEVGYTTYVLSIAAPLVAGVLGMLVAAYIFIRDARRAKIHVRRKNTARGGDC